VSTTTTTAFAGTEATGDGLARSAASSRPVPARYQSPAGTGNFSTILNSSGSFASGGDSRSSTMSAEDFATVRRASDLGGGGGGRGDAVAVPVMRRRAAGSGGGGGGGGADTPSSASSAASWRRGGGAASSSQQQQQQRYSTASSTEQSSVSVELGNESSVGRASPFVAEGLSIGQSVSRSKCRFL